MKYHTKDELTVIEEFKRNRGQLVISYRTDGTMKKYNSSFASTFSILLRRGIIERIASGDFRWVKYRLKETNKS